MDSSPEEPSGTIALHAESAEVLQWLRRGLDEHVIVAITDARGVILFANERFCAISGYRRDELIGRTHRVVKSELHPPEFFRQMWRTLNAGQVWQGTICNRAKAGHLYWVETTLMPILGADGRPRYHLALRTDVTRLKRAENELAQRTHELEDRVDELAAARQARDFAHAELQLAHEQLRIFFDHAPIGISWLEWGRDGHSDIYHLNQRFCEIIGLDAEKAQSFENIRSITHPEDRSRQTALMQAIHRGERDSFTLEKRYLHPAGHLVWGSLTVAVLRGPEGQITHQFAMLEDVTERRRAEQELREALRRREELERIVNRSPSVALLCRIEAGWPIEYVSPSIRQFGYEPEDLTSGRLTVIDLVHPEDRERVSAEIEAHATSQHQEYSQAYRLVCAGGAIRWVNANTVVRVHADGRPTHHEVLVMDVTLRKEAEDRERDLRERDLRLAGEVQQYLHPRVFPDIAAVEVEALSVSSMHLGGDYYDVIRVDEHRWGFAMADVAGKGAGAALMMAACRATLRLCADGEQSPARVIRRINRALEADMPKGMFITLFYGILDLSTHRFRFARAGHEPGLLMRRGAGAPELLPGDGLALGLDAGALFNEMLQENELTLASGDLLGLYTDGITEAINATGDEFGRDRLAAALLRHEDRSLADVVRTLDRYLRQFSVLAPRHDDRTLLLLRLR